MSETLRREVRVGHQGEGRHSQLRFEWFLHGPLGTVQFVVWVRPEGDGPGFDRQWAVTGVDVGYHAREPQYEGQASTECDVIGGNCYYDGSGLQAKELLRRFECEGDKAIWETLEDRYRGWLEGGYEREEAAVYSWEGTDDDEDDYEDDDYWT